MYAQSVSLATCMAITTSVTLRSVDPLVKSIIATTAHREITARVFSAIMDILCIIHLVSITLIFIVMLIIVIPVFHTTLISV